MNIMMFFDENHNMVRCINGEFYERPFVNDKVLIERKSYKVISTTIDYDDNGLIVVIRPV